MSDPFRVPTLDLAGLRVDRAGFGIRLRDALHEKGICYLTGPDIRKLPVVDVLTATRGFFAHSTESGIVDYARLCDDTALTTVELRPMVSLWAQGLAALAPELLGALAQALGQPENYFDQWIGRARLRAGLVHVMPGDGESDTAPRDDFGFLNFLLPDLLCGMRVGDGAGGWADVFPRENSVLLTLGDGAEAATAGFLRAAPHRLWSPHASKGRVAVTVTVDSGIESPSAPPELATHSLVN
ncbi:isopenicillin N synthase family oxygenase [Nocardia uniformis]|uniref:Isopenicillin N synthase family oxygenase n=1 Tax=Nocardia uniformis TaxID=53432 RepID=A0A849CD37_9NOCA|nr:2OG-Fe(II) oxygenase family protein [Nocardia uniformis]NNH73009.1 isopenicillin N synthase family oxygenase [Nocardia uniformis]